MIHSWFINQPASLRSTAPTVCFFHGNAANIGFRLFNVKTMFEACQCNVLMLEYRGYGESGGEASELGLQRDAAAALAFLHSLGDIDRRKIFLFGRSLGGAVAIHLAHAANHQSPPLAGIILENTFTSIEDIVVVLMQRMIPLRVGESFVRFVLHWFMTSHWNSVKLIDSIACPILFLSGLMDELVPAAQMQQLYDKAIKSSFRHIHPVPSGDHNSTYIQGGLEYWRAFATFIHSRCRVIDETTRVKYGNSSDQSKVASNAPSSG